MLIAGWTRAVGVDDAGFKPTNLNLFAFPMLNLEYKIEFWCFWVVGPGGSHPESVLIVYQDLDALKRLKGLHDCSPNGGT